MVVGVPVLFYRGANDPFNVPKLSWLIMCVTLGLGLVVIENLQGRSLLGFKEMWVPAALMLGPLVLAWAAGPYREWSLFGFYGRFQGLIPYILVVLAGILISDGFTGRAYQLSWALVIAGAVAGGYSLLQVIGLDPFDWNTSQTSTVGNTNFAGGFLAMVTPVTLALWFADMGRRSTIWKLGVLILGGLLVSQSQGGYAAAIAGAAVLLGFIYERRFTWARLLGITIAGAVAAVTLGVVGYAMLNPDSDSVPATVVQRALWWRGAIDMAMDSPILGRGPSAYAVEGIQHRPPEDSIERNIDTSDDTHSVPLALLTGAGVVGLAGFIGVGIWCLRRFRSSERTILTLGFASAIVAYYVQSLVSIDELTLRFSFWVLVGGFVASTLPVEAVATSLANKPGAKKKVVKRSRRQPLKKPVAVTLVTIVSLTGVVWAIGFLLQDVKVRDALALYASDESQEAHDKMESARSFREDYHYAHLDAFGLAEDALTDTGLIRDLAAESLRTYDFTEGFPSFTTLFDKARNLQSFSERVPAFRDEATAAFIDVVQLDPLNTWVLQNAAEAWTANEAYEELIVRVQPKMDEFGTYGEVFWTYLAHAYAQTGQMDLARGALDEVDPVLDGSPLVEATKVLLEQS